MITYGLEFYKYIPDIVIPDHLFVKLSILICNVNSNTDIYSFLFRKSVIRSLVKWISNKIRFKDIL